jgi:hypothetical protein
MSQSVEYVFSEASYGSSFRLGRKSVPSSDAVPIAACEAAKEAVRAFEMAADRGESFEKLCELLELEHNAVEAVSKIKCNTPLGLAEKAFLLDCLSGADNRSALKQESTKIAISLAADAVALAKAMAGAGAPRS